MRVKATVSLKAVAPNPRPLIEFLKAYRDSIQLIVNEIWELDYIPSVKKLHEMFYGWLRAKGFRAHHASEIYKLAKELVKATKKSKGSKPILKRLTARLHTYEYRLEISNRHMKVAVLNGEWVELKLQSIWRLTKFLDKGWRPKEVFISYKNNKGFIAYITLERTIQQRTPETIMGVDINLDNASYVIIDMRGNIITAGIIMFDGFKQALHYRKLAERLQKRLGTHWRFMRWSRHAYRRCMRRARNRVMDTAHYVSKRLVEIADEYDSIIILENLKGLRQRACYTNGRLAWLFTQMAYRKLQYYTSYKASWRGLNILRVSPKNTSKTSPLGKIMRLNYRWVKLPNGAVTTRDIIAAWNLALRGLKQMQMKGLEVRWSPDSRGDESMKSRGKPRNDEPHILA